MNKRFYSTRQVAELLGVKTSWLSQIVFRRAIREPRRGPGRFFLWTARDIRRVEKLLAKNARGRASNGRRSTSALGTAEIGKAR